MGKIRGRDKGLYQARDPGMARNIRQRRGGGTGVRPGGFFDEGAGGDNEFPG
ncbi:hypothetical protein LINPERHAP1_LOCUS36283 [Linum perenne]